jgi:hypothetical protein
VSGVRPPAPDASEGEAAEEASSATARPGEPPSPARPRLTWARRLAPAAIALAVAALVSPLAERWPSDHALEVVLDAPAAVTEVSLTVSRAGEEPIHATTWSFRPGEAPDRLRTAVHGPDGAYEILLEIAHGGGESSTRLHRMELDGARLAIVHGR